ncbi:MAG: hypothetical protein EXQ81_09255 [Thermoleophilia bacterium]|nr:hypothetical protein [Thermoleophilia bacterium]
MSPSQQLTERLDRGRDGIKGLWLERAEAFGKPGCAALAHGAEGTLALDGQLEPDPAAVGCRADANEQARALEPVDVAR